jgi:hypothetical protein
MSTPDDPSDELDLRPVKPHHYRRDVMAIQDAEIKRRKVAGIAIDRKILARVFYTQDVLIHGNSGGRSNPTIDLPVPWTILDIEAIIGPPEDLTPGSDAAWRRVRKHYDATHTGRGEGRTR